MQALDELEKRYPGVFLRLRYEDLVDHPDDTISSLFQHIDMDPMPSAYQWLHNSLHGSSDSGVERTNATYIVSKWRLKFTDSVIDSVTNDPRCQSVLADLGYS
jgi:hypothetical protein